MKTLKITFAILIITFFTFSCSKDDNNSTPATPTADYFFKAKIDGVQYQTDAAYRVLADVGTNIKVNSVLADNRNFELKISNHTGVGTYTYPVPAGSDYILTMEYGDGSSASALWRTGVCTGTTGTITITALSATEVAGTFSFTGKRTSFCSDPAKLITEGSFKSGITQ